MDVISFLSSDNYIALNRDLVKLFGLHEAVLFSELCSEYRYWSNNNGIEDGYFYSTIENIEYMTGMTRKQQDSSFKKLKELGVIDLKLKGMPAKRFIKINLDKLEIVLNGQTRLSKKGKQDCPKVTTNNNNYNKNIENKNKYIYKENYIKESKGAHAPSSKLNDRNFASYLDIRISDEDRNNPDSEIF